MDRYISLNFVVTMRLFPILLGMVLVVLIIDEGPDEKTTPLWSLLSLAFQILLYGKVAAHLRSVAAREIPAPGGTD